MAKKISAFIKLQIPAGKANPSPPVGPALGQHGVNIMEFCKAFNARTQELGDTIVPVVITVYADRSFSYITKTTPASVLLMKAAGLKKASSNPKADRVAEIGMDKIVPQRAAVEVVRFQNIPSTKIAVTPGLIIPVYS